MLERGGQATDDAARQGGAASSEDPTSVEPGPGPGGHREELLLTGGALLAFFLLRQLWWTDIEAPGGADRFLEATRQSFAQGQGAAEGRVGAMQGQAVEGTAGAGSVGAGEGKAGMDQAEPSTTAIVHLPTIGEVRPVNEGVELSVLNRGVLGHYADTAAPGGIGNFAVAGHRTTYGRPLWDVASLRPGDPVVVETATDYHVYRLSELRIVQPEQTEVVAPVPGRPGAAPTERWLVMTACHPKFSASQRIVALSRLDYSQPRLAGIPIELAGG